jgi:hypothetical protein
VAHASIEILGKNPASSAGKSDFFNRLLVGTVGMADSSGMVLTITERIDGAGSMESDAGSSTVLGSAGGAVGGPAAWPVA